MIPVHDTKFVPIAIPEAKVDAASVTTASIDTRGFDYAQIYVLLGDLDIALSALKIQESDDDGNSDAYADITGATMDGGTDIQGTTLALPSASDDDQTHVFEIDLRGRKRYLDVVATVGDGSTGAWVYIFAVLSRSSQGLNTNAERNITSVIQV